MKRATFLKKMNLKKLFKKKDVEGYETLQKRVENKKEFLEKILECFNNFHDYLNNFSEKIKNLNSTLNHITFSPEEKCFHDTAKLIYRKIYSNFEQNSVLLAKLINYISGHISKLDKEVSFYQQLKKINKDLIEEKEKLKKNKEIYHKAAKEAEDKIKIKNITNINQIYKNDILRKNIEAIASTPKKALNNYKQSIVKTNEIIKKYNEKLSYILNYFPELANEDGVFLFRLLKIYLQNLEDESKFANKNINDINNSKSLGTNSELKELIEKTEKNNLYEEKEKLIQYGTELSYLNCQNKKEFELYSNCVNIINNFIDKDIFPNYNYDIELNNYKICSLITKLFKEKGEIDIKLSDEFLKLINNPSVHKSAFIILSKLRTRGTYEYPKCLIELLGKGFNILINYAGKNKLYNNIDDGLILSQTYYYKDDNKNKIYISEYLKNNNILLNTKILRNYIDAMIRRELNNFKNNCHLNNIEIVNNKLDGLIFSQLLTSINIMKDFNFDKRVILKIIDEFIEKYDYMSDNNINVLYDMITEGKDSLENLRKEYNSSLESELIDNININNIENDKEEEENENIEIGNIEEDINIENEKLFNLMKKKK